MSKVQTGKYVYGGHEFIIPEISYDGKFMHADSISLKIDVNHPIIRDVNYLGLKPQAF